MSEKHLFGTDGVRGVANVDLDAELALKLGKAAAFVLKTSDKPLKVVIARDTRQSGNMLESALSAGLASLGADVVLLGVAPTPTVAYLVKNGDFDIGAVISASHNPAKDNGIKFFGSDGRKLPDSVEAEIEKALAKIDTIPLVDGVHVGTISYSTEPIEHYFDFLCGLIEKPLQGMTIVVDGANGAAYDLARRVLREQGALVLSLGCDPDGKNINLDCGSTHPELMMSAVLRHKAQIGVAFDGDADRAILADENGMRIDGDRIIGMWAKHRKALGLLNPPIVVGTVMSNMGFENALKDDGIELVRTQVGDRYVSTAMIERKALVGGEQSGHIIFSELSTTGDGLITLLETLKVMQDVDKPLSELAHFFTPWHQRLINLKVNQPKKWKDDAQVAEAVNEMENFISGKGRINVRPSGTEPVLRVMIEAETNDLLETVQKRLITVIQERLSGEIHSVTELSE